jgi:3-deoxy-D-manno-octulosonate 8-phosphate phosphatase KdsC-like HAD superfamily phosphatase
VVFIAADNKINYNLFRNKNIPFYYEPKNKKQALLQVFKRYSVSPDNVMYIGSNYSDLECMRQIPISVCAEDAVPELKNIAALKLPIYGGDGVFAMLYEYLKPEIQRRLAK